MPSRRRSKLEMIAALRAGAAGAIAAHMVLTAVRAS